MSDADVLFADSVFLLSDDLSSAFLSLLLPHAIMENAIAPASSNAANFFISFPPCFE